jgi:glyoxylase-like metal-dependent hydrolase (beta-lactamase superfamily II)
VIKLGAGEFRVISDGWMKIDRTDFTVGLSNVRDARLFIGLNQLLVRTAGKNVLVDAGLGNKWRPEDVGLIGFQRPRGLLTALEDAGVSQEDIDAVIYTHLHYDHSGGGTCRKEDNSIAPTFTNAVYYVQRNEVEFAFEQIKKGSDDYRIEDLQPLQSSGQLVELEGQHEILPGVHLYPAPGHTPGHQVVVFELPSGKVFFPGDLISTRAHANLKVTMTYDSDRDVLLAERNKWLKVARNGGWQTVLCHAVRDAVLTFHV